MTTAPENPYNVTKLLAKKPRQLSRREFRVIGIDTEVCRGQVVLLCSSGVPNAKSGKFMRSDRILYPNLEQAVEFLWKNMPISKRKYQTRLGILEHQIRFFGFIQELV